MFTFGPAYLVPDDPVLVVFTSALEQPPNAAERHIGRIRSGTLCSMADRFAGVFAQLKPVLANYAKRLAVKADTSIEYTLVTKSASPFPQHRGQPLHFGSVRLGKAYVSFHLMPLYMCPVLTKTVSPALKKRMQGKTCFNFKTDPEPDLIAELRRLTEAGFTQWSEKKWV